MLFSGFAGIVIADGRTVGRENTSKILKSALNSGREFYFRQIAFPETICIREKGNNALPGL
jgi:hypothetical protein